MSGAKFLFALMLFSAILFSASLNELIKQKTEPMDEVVQTPLLSKTDTCTLLKLNGEETFIYCQNAGAFLPDEQKIREALVNNVYETAQYDAKTQAADSAVSSFASGKDEDEKKCDQYLGVDKLPCTDRETCVVACFAVPLCDSQINGAGFWEAMLDYTQKTAQLDSELSSFSGIDDSNLDVKISKLNSMILIASNLSQSNIFRNRTDTGCDVFGAQCFEFCKKTDYGTENLESAKAGLVQLKTDLQQVNAQTSRASAIYAQTQKQNTYLAERGQRYLNLKMTVALKTQSLNNSFAELSKKVSDSKVPPLLSTLSNYSAEINSLGTGGNYRKAFAKGELFNFTSKEAETAISAMSGQYSSLIKKFEQVTQKYTSALPLLANGSEIRTEYNSTSVKLSVQISSSDISKLSASVDSLNAKLNDVIAQAALSGTPLGGNVTQTPSTALPAGIPCPISLAIIFIAATLFIRKN
ncbi:hypothetical protein COV61_03805 [Candidatus Micrarchaeota archaeon CG11_big_fil_rev_8_21_14_0_20_47_5]|nr:MAG: hypothetical protein COV61_03805 [Candidatus Micrarchaeota archaeon CG11_big_fil_rev_8_21_14_0_20_47_5]